jgi:hypothetical protein
VDSIVAVNEAAVIPSEYDRVSVGYCAEVPNVAGVAVSEADSEVAISDTTVPTVVDCVLSVAEPVTGDEADVDTPDSEVSEEDSVPLGIVFEMDSVTEDSEVELGAVVVVIPEVVIDPLCSTVVGAGVSSPAVEAVSDLPVDVVVISDSV